MPVRQDPTIQGSGVFVPGPAFDQRASMAARICRKGRRWRSIEITSRVIPTQTPQPRPWASSVSHPSAWNAFT